MDVLRSATKLRSGDNALFIARRSAWTYNTSGSVGAGYGVYAGEIGELVLNDPRKQVVTLKYAGGGFGPGIGVKLPKAINRILRDVLEHELSGSVGPLSFDSSGTVFVTRWCSHEELTKSTLRVAACSARSTSPS